MTLLITKYNAILPISIIYTHQSNTINSMLGRTNELFHHAAGTILQTWDAAYLILVNKLLYQEYL